MNTADPIGAQEPGAALAGGCIIATPLALIGLFKYMLKAAEAKEHAMSHQVEEVELQGVLAEASTIPAEESLGRFVAGLRRTTAPFEKMGARFEKANWESELKKLENVKKKFEAEGKTPGPESAQLLLEAEQTLKRYAPN